MAIAASSSFSLGSSYRHSCQSEGVCCSTSCGIISFQNRFKDDQQFPVLACIRKSSFGSTQFHWSHGGYDSCLSKVQVGADYSDSIPDSSSFMEGQGYHPLEELKECKEIRDRPTAAEVARTTAKANRSALLIFPWSSHSEPHKCISWAEYQYLIDGRDIVFQIFDDQNILRDPGGSNIVNALIGMDASRYKNRRVSGKYSISGSGSNKNNSFVDNFFKVHGSRMSDFLLDWEIPDPSGFVHPIYFSKCLTQTMDMEYAEEMDHPSNGISILGSLSPAYIDEEPYLRWLFSLKDVGNDLLDWEDDEIMGFSSKRNRNSTRSTLYRLDILRIELFSVYGIQSMISLQDYLSAIPDVLVPFASLIVKSINESGRWGNIALKALCRRKGLLVEEATLIGVDSFGMDVRVTNGVEVQTHRFPFKVRATTRAAAEKQIRRLLYPSAHQQKIENSL